MIATLLLSVTVFVPAGQSPAFDVVSVKGANPGTPGMSMQTSPGRFVARGATLRFLIQYAYGLKPFQISGGPDWIDSEKFEIEGRTSSEENKKDDGRLLLMLQAALAERFKLKSHYETQELPVYELVVGRNGHKLKEAKSSSISGSSGFGSGRGVAAPAAGLGRFTSLNASTQNVAAQLSQILGRSVLDRTGLTGKFDVTLEWARDNQSPPAPGDPVPEPAGPSIFTAVQEQLGLRLEPTKGPVQIFVIDSVEKPSEN